MSWISENKKRLMNNIIKNDYPAARLVILLFFLGSLLLLISLFYLEHINFAGLSSSFYSPFYLFCWVGVLFWGFVICLRGVIQLNILIVTISILVGIYMIESALYLWSPAQSDNVLNTRNLNIEFDKRTRFEIIEDLKVEGLNAVPSIHTKELINGSTNDLLSSKGYKNLDSLLPLAGVSKKTTVLDNESGKFVVYKSDRYGFNNPDNLWDSKSVEWLFIGDSYTQGSSVQPGEEVAAQLRSITSNSAISLGIGGHAPLLEYATLVEYGPSLAPKKVLWMYFEGNDLLDLTGELSNKLLMQYMENGFTQNLINRQKEIDKTLTEVIAISTQLNYYCCQPINDAKINAKIKKNKDEDRIIIKKTKFKQFIDKTRWARLWHLRNLIESTFNNSDSIDDVNVEFLVKILSNAKSKVESWGGELYFVYLPEYYRLTNIPWSSIRFDFLRKKHQVLSGVRQLDIPVIDISKNFFNHPDPLSLYPFRQPGHFNAQGYSEVAKGIIKGTK